MEEPGRLQSTGSLESDTTERLHFHFSLSCIGEGEMATHSSVLAWRIPGVGSLVGCRLWGRTESDTTEVTQQQQHGPNIPGSYAILFFTASDFTFTTRHIYSWVSFLLWPSRFILSGAISNCPPLFPSSISDTFWHRGLIFQCHIFLPFFTVHGVLVARILEWVVISSSSGPHFFRTLHYDLSILGGPAQHGS